MTITTYSFRNVSTYVGVSQCHGDMVTEMTRCKIRLLCFVNTSRECLIVTAESVGQSADGNLHSLVLFLDKFIWNLNLD